MTLKDQGSIRIGEDFGSGGVNHNSLSTITVFAKDFRGIKNILSFMGLEKILQRSSEQDIERMKLGLLFRMFFPLSATRFERTEPFFTLPIEELQETIKKRDGGMERVFSQFLSSMHPVEILPGKNRFFVEGVADKTRELGAIALTATTCYEKSFEECNNDIVAILLLGMLSSEGISTDIIRMAGSSDTVFTRLVTKNICDKKNPLELLSHYRWYRPQLLLSLDILGTGTYQYLHCEEGIRSGETYLHRPDIFHFTESFMKDGFYSSNEVMIKDRVPPEMIQGIIVGSTEIKRHLLTNLRAHNLIERNEKGEEFILGIPAEKFVRVTDLCSLIP